MAKIFNYTNRIEIPKECFPICKLTTRENETFLDISWDFSLLELPPEAAMTIEIGAIGTFQTLNLPLGLVGSGIQTETQISVQEIRNPELIQFRFKVVKRSDSGIPLIVAQVDKMKPEFEDLDGVRPSLLKRRKIQSLAVPWELRFESGIPMLCISGQKDMWFTLLKKAPWFDPIILPSIVRQIFLWSIDEATEPEDPDTHESWKKYFINHIRR